MDFKQVKELLKLINELELGEFQVERDDFFLHVRSKEYVDALKASKKGSAPVMMQHHAPQEVAPQQSSAPAPQQAEAPKEDTSNLITVKSPMIGTFYRSTSPDKDPFVKVGDNIKSGDVICIVEAMKLFNEIESEVSGKIVEVLIDNSSPVEYDQPMFLVDPGH